jgi:hypothetical protein
LEEIIKSLVGDFLTGIALTNIAPTEDLFEIDDKSNTVPIKNTNSNNDNRTIAISNPTFIDLSVNIFDFGFIYRYFNATK